MSLVETISKGLNNPDCAFYVGQSLGYGQAGSLIFRVALIYFGLRLVDKLVFVGIPRLYRKYKKEGKV